MVKVPFGITVDAANRHDMKMTKTTLQRIVVNGPEPTTSAKQHMCMDKGYDYPAHCNRDYEVRSIDLGFCRMPCAAQLTGYNVPSQLVTRFYFCTNYKQTIQYIVVLIFLLPCLRHRLQA